ncbi:MAG: pyridoxal phosphate-dependent aminotransferase [Candidatus Aminicenantales bacterium]|nr:pyridoxal phosphate-dependent aminotransferase [Acidobacteriota bacterium]
MSISRRAQDIQASPIRKLKPLADEAKKRGIHIFHLNIGDPDIPTPQPVIEAFHAYHDPILGYGPSQGFDELRQAIADYFLGYGLKLIADNVLITIGGSEAVHFAFSVVADPGEEIIIPEPFYTNYNGFATFADVRIVPLPLKVEDGFRLPPAEKIEALITPKTRAVLLCSPNNPTGTVYSEEELRRVVEVVKKHDLFLIGDEVYKEFVYDGLKHKSLLEFKEVEDRVIVVDSISKRFSCCGARIGAVITRNQEVYQATLKFAQARLCPPSVEQYAAIAAYKMGMGYFEPIRQEYQRRRDVLYKGLTSIPGVVLRQPEGAFYVLCRLPVKDSEHFVRWMLTDFSINKKTVMTAPGPGFYATPGRGQDEVRIAYVLKEEDLVEAIEILRQGLEKYRKLFA